MEDFIYRNFKWNRIKLPYAHALLSPSNYHWINYTDDKLVKYYYSDQKKQLGTEIHAMASWLIKNKKKLQRSNDTLNRFVNDSINYDMESEMPLYYSNQCFGTADAISFDGEILRIFDLKTGDTPAHFEQLYLYAALFCLQYNVNPLTIETECRIYQFDDKEIRKPEPELIHSFMDKITHADDIIGGILSE